MPQWSRSVLLFILQTIAVIGLLLGSPVPGGAAEEHSTKIRISNASLSFTALPLIAAKEWGTFKANGMDAEIIIMASSVAAPALLRGDVDYVGGVGPASVSASLSGLPSKAIWSSSDRIIYWLMAQPKFKRVEDLKARKIALTGLGGTTHVSFLMALEEIGADAKNFVMVSMPGQQLLQSLQSGFVDAAILPPPQVFQAQEEGFNKLIDVGSMVEMPAGGLTALVKTIETRPAEVKKVIRSVQLAKDEIRKSRDKTIDLLVRVLKMDKGTAAKTYDAYLASLSLTGIPSPKGIGNLIKAIQSQGRFTDRQIAFSDVADARLATEVAKEMGYKID